MGLNFPDRMKNLNLAMTVSQRIIRLLGSLLRGANSLGDITDDKLKTLLAKMGDVIDNGEFDLNRQGAPIVVMDDLQREFRRIWGRDIDLNNHADLLRASNLMYGREGAPLRRRILTPFKWGWVNATSFVVGAAATLAISLHDKPDSTGDYMKLGSSVGVTIAGGFNGGYKYRFNDKLLNETMTRVGDFAKAEKNVWTDRL